MAAATKKQKRNVPLRLTDSELCKLHALAGASGHSIVTMLRIWIDERWRASRGDAPPPGIVTKGGVAIHPERR